ncbi:uncharacterized protein LOC142982754 [Anticarsia gemmatalis]|uniref:uncharacterized protein LOC142982754 n=1 Tax=Anticarsia gemmatalis TaxID=129554 RepID=UPI003F7625BC
MFLFAHKMGDKKVWERSEVVQLIEKYKSKRHLWDTTSKDYRNKIKKNAALKSLAQEFNTTHIEVWRKLHNLKTQFGQEYKKVQKRNAEEESDEVYKSKWEYYDKLMFIITGQDTPAPPSEPEDSMDSVEVLECELSSEDIAHSAPVTKRQKQTPQPNYIHFPQHNDSSEEKPVKTSLKVHDEYQIFGDYVASEIRNMHSPKYKGILKRKIQRLIIAYTDVDDNDFFNESLNTPSTST